ncbi:hypothetical protein [Pelagibaculum spongiae]|uniref:Uncharacterized protein n=1 Tax=Pelagibaculum spongiae TaxID=2080658 RepID=A0A2V1GX76_9GAMM|nr:hypothetical protein [Pelagibaculum spongiae]PVZ66295.1 hypothetical protein DC094_16465 [Pelagibaculum spongiae]
MPYTGDALRNIENPLATESIQHAPKFNDLNQKTEMVSQPLFNFLTSNLNSVEPITGRDAKKPTNTPQSTELSATDKS